VRPGVPHALWVLGSLARANGDYARADGMFSECLVAARTVGDVWSMAMALRSLRGVRYLTNDLTPAVALLRDALAGFANLGNGRMIADCLEGLAAAFAAAGKPGDALIANGLSNRDIATRLVITEMMVEVHVKHILNKLGFRSRSQVAVWAAEHGFTHTSAHHS
jgi:hypothetical protein